MTPLLILLFGIHPVTAVGTDLLFAAATKSVGTLVNGLHRTVAWRVTGLLAAGSLPAAGATLALVSRMGLQDQTANTMIRAVLAAVLLLTALSLVARRHIIALAQARLLDVGPRGSAVLTVATGAVLGVLVSLTSVGAGAVGIIGLLLLYPRMPLARIVGSDIAHAVPLTLLAGVGHWMMGSVDWPLLGSLLAGSVPGIVVGSYASAHVPERLLRAVLAATLIIVAVKTVL
jgi:uncharacterized membrane protein YfcA